MNFKKLNYVNWKFVVRQSVFILLAILILFFGYLAGERVLQAFALLPLALALTKPGFYIEAPREGETLQDFFKHIREQLIF